MGNILQQLAPSLPFVFYGFAGLYVLVILLLALAVMRDARLRQLTNRGTFLVGPWIWFLIVLATGGFTGAFAYWIIHYSALRHQPRAQAGEA